MAEPKLDLGQPHGEIYGSGGLDGNDAARYVQGGHYFTASQKYLRSDPGATQIAVAEEAPVPVTPGELTLELEEIEELLTDPKADQMLLLPLDQLAEMVAEAGGPSFSGDNAIKYNVAWLLKHTAQ